MARVQSLLLDDCLKLNKESIRFDPCNVRGWVNIGWVHWQRYALGWSGNPEMELSLAEECASKADAIDPIHATTRSLSAWSLAFRGQFSEAVAEAKRGTELDSNNGLLWNVLGAMLIRADGANGGLPSIQRGMALIPQPVGTLLNNFGTALVLLHREEEAVPALRRAMGCFRLPLTPAILAAALLGLGRTEEGRITMNEIRVRDPDFDPIGAPHLTRFKNPEFPMRVSQCLRELGWK